jgi:hypothetical protein
VSRGSPAGLTVDGAKVEGTAVALVDDGAEHRVELRVA